MRVGSRIEAARCSLGLELEPFLRRELAGRDSGSRRLRRQDAVLEEHRQRDAGRRQKVDQHLRVGLVGVERVVELGRDLAQLRQPIPRNGREVVVLDVHAEVEAQQRHGCVDRVGRLVCHELASEIDSSRDECEQGYERAERLREIELRLRLRLRCAYPS